MATKDEIYRRTAAAAPFVFDEAVAGVFPDMIARSVPGYGEVVALSGVIAAAHLRRGANCYDLGCAVGDSAMAVLRHAKTADFHVIAVDNSAAMIGRCRRRLRGAGGGRATCVHADIEDIEIADASAVLLNYTLQFIPPPRRQALLEKIHRGMNAGGVLILSEKIVFDDAAEQRRQTTLHELFKRAHGYSELEISRKRAALENVLTPESAAAHLKRLRAAGFRDAQVWHRAINFASMLAWK